ncbi:MAG: ketopantoate reductase family protein [Anaerolineaceae bacterium]|nr:ketopantoate reductase family protein [Anaerolineaceae bacterium]
MKILILGAGGWGALVGAYLAEAGADVTMLFRRQAHVDEIEKNGGRLIIEKPEGEVFVPVKATTDPGAIDAVDLMIVAVKNHDTQSALESVAHVKVKAVASVQNGLGHSERFKAAYPEAEVLRIVSRVAGSLINYGRVKRGDDDFPTWIGNPEAGITPYVEEVSALFNQAGLPCQAVDNIEEIEWCKLIWWTPSSISAVLARLPQTDVMQSPDFAYIMVMMTRDMVRTANALGVKVKDYPTIEVMDRCEGSIEEGVARVIEHGREWEERGGAGYKQAMLLDIERERRTEITDTGLFIWKLARENKIEVPYLEMGVRIVRGLEERFS